MIKIDRSYETMTSKQRVRCVIYREKPDRVPINYHSNPGIDGRLKQYFGLNPNDTLGLFETLGVDFRGIGAPYTGPALHTSARSDRYVHPHYGFVLRWIENQSGGYWDYCDFPLESATVEEVAAWKFPDPDLYDYSSCEAQLAANSGYGTHLGGAGLGCIMNNIGFFRSMEQMFVDLITNDEAGMLLTDRFIKHQLAILERELNAIEKIAKKQAKRVNELIDFVWMGEDLGTQHTPLISMDIFRRQLLPRQKPFFDLCNSYDLPVMMHTCGSSSWAYEDYIKLGLKGADTLQPEATNMEPEYLKKTFGGRLFFHGCISTGGPMAFGTREDTIADCNKILEIMKPNYEYCFAPTHSLQDNTPPENVAAAYLCAHTSGRY